MCRSILLEIPLREILHEAVKWNVIVTVKYIYI